MSDATRRPGRTPLRTVLDRLDPQAAQAGAPPYIYRPVELQGRAAAGVLERLRALAWVGTPAVIAVASRVWSAFWMMALIPAVHTARGLPFAIWDAIWYFGVVKNGYHGHAVRGAHDFAFFPAWPALIKLGSLTGLHPALVGTVLANLLFVAAAILTWRVLDLRLGGTVATGGLLLLSFAPSAYVFSMAYSEPLFLLATAAYFLASNTSARRGLFAGLAMLTRIAGAAVAASALVQFVFGPRPGRRTAFLVMLATSLVFGIWWMFIAYLTHRFTGFLSGSPAWVHGGTGLERLVEAVRRPTIQRVGWIAFFVIVGLGALALLRVDRELAVFSIAAIALAFLPGGLVPSMPRYALAAFPAFAGLALLFGRRGTWAIAGCFALAQIAFVAWMIALPGGQAP